MIRSKLLLGSSLCFGLVVGSGCFIVDDAPLDELTVVDTPDSGTIPVAESCGGPGYRIVDSDDYPIQTVGASSDLNTSLCPGASSTGPDVFLGLEATQGQYWHFHVAPAPGNTTVVDPVVSLFRVGSNGQCNTTDCTYVTNRCSGDQEHFGVEIPANPGGTWALAIDNAMNTEGRFTVAVYQPICGDGEVVHGESCDPMFPGMETTCDSKCRRLLATGATEVEPNDDRFWANHVNIGAGQTATISAPAGASGTCDPDVFMLSVAGGHPFTATAMMTGTGNCRLFSEFSTKLSMRATTATGTTLASLSSGPGGCAIVTATPGADTEVFITVEGATGTVDLEPYELQFSIQ